MATKEWRRKGRRNSGQVKADLLAVITAANEWISRRDIERALGSNCLSPTEKEALAELWKHGEIETKLVPSVIPGREKRLYRLPQGK